MELTFFTLSQWWLLLLSFNFFWSIVDLQCCISFKCTSKWICNAYTCYLRVLSCVWLFVTSWTVACQAPLPVEFSKQDCWSQLPFLTSEDLPYPVIEAIFPVSPTLTDKFFTSTPPGLAISIWRKWQLPPRTLAWKTPWAEEPARLQPMESQRVGHDWATSLSLRFNFFSLIGHYTVLSRVLCAIQ